jgi:hypothetical protein
MHSRFAQVFHKSQIAQIVLLVAIGTGPAIADDSGFFGRLFRLGGGGQNQSQPAPAQTVSPSGGSGSQSGATNPFISNFGSQGPVSTAPSGSSGPAARVSPRPRVTSAITTADPLVTRVSLGRSNDGSQFGMFLQVFADGTVIDSEGTHHLRAADLKPIVDTVASGDLFRSRGHCGAPATDFVDYVHMIVYERRLGRLTASSFSYSGNPQGCEHAVRHLHTLLDNVQAKLSGQPAAASAGVGAPTGPLPLAPSSGFGAERSTRDLSTSPPNLPRQPAPPAVNPGGGGATGSVIPLTPADSSR